MALAEGPFSPCLRTWFTTILGGMFDRRNGRIFRVRDDGSEGADLLFFEARQRVRLGRRPHDGLRAGGALGR